MPAGPLGRVRQPLTDELSSAIMADHDRLAADGLRVLAIAVLVPPFPGIFGLAAPGFDELKILVLFPGVILLLEETRKAIVRGVPVGRTTDLVEGRSAR